MARKKCTITVTEDQRDTLTLALGMASGVSGRDGNWALALACMELANVVNKDNPNWRPYEIRTDGTKDSHNPDAEGNRTLPQ